MAQLVRADSVACPRGPGIVPTYLDDVLTATDITLTAGTAYKLDCAGRLLQKLVIALWDFAGTAVYVLVDGTVAAPATATHALVERLDADTPRYQLGDKARPNVFTSVSILPVGQNLVLSGAGKNCTVLVWYAL